MSTLMRDKHSTQNVLQRMFMEDTGIHFLDSGGVDGRGWQRNADGEFANKPEAYIEHGEVRLSTYHYLLKRLEYNQFQTEQFNYMFPNGAGMNDMLDYVINRNLDSRWQVYNTYNFDTLLDQDIQFLEFTIDDGWGEVHTYVILQIHNGADARGGYTNPVIFKACSEYWIHQCNDVSLWCDDCSIPIYSFGGEIEQPVQSVDIKSKVTLSGGQEKVSHYYETFDVDSSIMWNAECPSCNVEMVAEAPDPDNSF